jgi:hypothetical protein
MTDIIGRYAQIKTGDIEVVNVIKMPASFSIEGFDFILIQDGVSCSEADFYNSGDGLFYTDREYKTISGTNVESETT